MEREGDAESENEALHGETDEVRRRTQLIKTESFCFNALTGNESGGELICLQGTQALHTHTHPMGRGLIAKRTAECCCHSYQLWQHIMRQS